MNGPLLILCLDSQSFVKCIELLRLNAYTTHVVFAEIETEVDGANFGLGGINKPISLQCAYWV